MSPASNANLPGQLPKVLVAGTDEVLLATRVEILRNRYRAASTAPETVLPSLHSEHFDLLLVCSSTPFETASEVIRHAHAEFPYLCIVRLLSPDRALRSKPVAHAIVTIDYHPESWIKAVDRLLTPGQKAAFA